MWVCYLHRTAVWKTENIHLIFPFDTRVGPKYLFSLPCPQPTRRETISAAYTEVRHPLRKRDGQTDLKLNRAMTRFLKKKEGKYVVYHFSLEKKIKKWEVQAKRSPNIFGNANSVFYLITQSSSFCVYQLLSHILEKTMYAKLYVEFDGFNQKYFGLKNFMNL